MGDIQEFLSFCDLVDFEYGSIEWRSARKDGGSLELEVFIETGSHELADRAWKIRVEEACEIDLKEQRLGAPEELTLSPDHVLLWPYKDMVNQLNFTGPSGTHESLLWDLHDRHWRVTKGWIPFESFINWNFIWNRLSGGHGVLASGPNRLLQEYASVLRESELEPYFPYPPHQPVRAYGPEGVSKLLWEEENPELSVLILFGPYVIGTGFSAESL